MAVWQLVIVLGAQVACWYLATQLTERRAARRDAARLHMDRTLNASLQQLFEQRGQQKP